MVAELTNPENMTRKAARMLFKARVMACARCKHTTGTLFAALDADGNKCFVCKRCLTRLQPELLATISATSRRDRREMMREAGK